ncbi:MAG TPA: hypothetical protein VHD56_19270 [Tepidisphaeraceae bacterium]|nr:hypothetical protein [Tepidisphaeraceae bacterium]
MTWRTNRVLLLLKGACHMRTAYFTLLAILNACAVAMAQAAAQPQTDVPVKTVVLFSSGVGYFEHLGNVQGNASTELRFKTAQINDILKSLVLQDLDKGTVSTVTYPSQDPLAKTLRSFQVDITSNPSLADLLNQIRGAKVTITSNAEKVSGTVLGVEKKQKSVGDKGNPIEVSVINILTGGTIRAIELDTVGTLVLDDSQLQEELTKALTALTQARDQDKKPVTINFTGEGNRRVRIGYVVETPIWKTSYRLIMDDKAGKLQGWAIVENQTDNDWNNVQLSLVSGRPISFVMDLYQPLYINRPIVVPELFASLRPRVYEGGMTTPAAPPEAFALNRAQALNGRGGGGGFDGRGGRDVVAMQGLAAPAREMSKSLSDLPQLEAISSIQAAASAAQVGELFQYTVGNVSLARQKSAMLPIINDSIDVERVSIYNASVLQKNPLNGARLKNTTDKHLLQGPITVLDAGSYAGDAQIDNVPPGQERLLSYGIDLQMMVDNTKNSENAAILSGKIVKGVLEISRRHQASLDYLAENKSDKDKTVIIEHPIRQGWKLIDTDKPIETTQTLYRFKGTVPAKKSSNLTVKEEIVDGETIALLPADIGQIDFYSRTSEIPKNVRDALVKAVQLKQAMVDTQRQIDEHNKSLSDITTEQNRIRENMRTVASNSQYYTRLMSKLNEQESQIEKLQSERDDLTKKLDDQRKGLEDYLGNLSLG